MGHAFGFKLHDLFAIAGQDILGQVDIFIDYFIDPLIWSLDVKDGEIVNPQLQDYQHYRDDHDSYDGGG